MTLLGEAMLWLSLLIALGTAGLVAAGSWKRDAALASVVRRSAHVLCGCLAVAALALIQATIGDW